MKPRTYSTALGESDTYDFAGRDEKEGIRSSEAEAHWALRAEREGVQAVMSARHSLSENERATLELQRDVLDFLGDRLDGKRVFELGVGIGRMTPEIAARAREVVGCDLTAKMLEKARERLAGFDNVKLHQGRILDLDLAPKSFDLTFESIVLLHILNPAELEATVARMREISRSVFLCEHTYEGPDFPISKYSILRKPEEYYKLMEPFRLAKERTHFCAGDRFTMMLYEE